MNILVTGDWHYRKKKPRNRLDANYQETINAKIKKVFDIAYHGVCEYIFQPGDMFDDADVSDRTKREFLNLMDKAPCPIITVPGQHDLRNHSRVWQNTPMGIADAGNNKVVVVTDTMKIKQFTVYSSGWGDPIPEPDPDDEFSILVCHKLVVKKTQPYAYDYFADEMLKKYKYDLIISGDNHSHFIEADSYRTLINCGSLMRTRIDQKDHHPCVYIYDVNKKVIKSKIQLEVEPFNEIMDVKKAEEEAEENEYLKSFLKIVRETKDDKENEELNFKKRLANRMTRSKALDTGPKGILKEVIDDANWTADR